MGLLSFLFGSKPPPVAGQQQPQGLLAPAAPVVNQKAYQDYAEMAMTKGQPVLPYAQWVKAQQAAAQPKPQQ